MIEKLMMKLINYELDHKNLDAIVVEGYDGVGKGTIMNSISEHYHVTPYRPDYNLWQQFDHRKIDRWKVSGFFWDVYSHFNIHSSKLMLFDRGVISGAVYNNDMTIADHYKEMLRDSVVLHVLVTCSDEDYLKFMRARNPEVSYDECERELERFHLYNSRYYEALNRSGADYIVYENEYDDTISSQTCKSCGHYSYGVCRHPQKNCEVSGDNPRCALSNDVEVQDNVTEM